MPQPSQQDIVNLTNALNRLAASLQQNTSSNKAQNNASKKATAAKAQASGGNTAQNVTQSAVAQAQSGGNSAGTKFGANFANAFQKKIKAANVSVNLSKYFMNALKGAFSLLTSLIGFIIGIIGTLWQKLVDMWEWYESILRKVYDATGLVGSEAERVRGMVVGVTNQYVRLGVTMESAAEAAGALTEEFHNIGILSAETLGTVSLLKTTMGVVEADGAKLTKIFMSMNGYSEKQTTALIASVKQMSIMAKVAPRKVMQDIAKNSEFVYKYFRGSTQNAAKFAVIINNIGKTMDIIKGAADSLMEWDSSIENEMNASVLLGRTVDFSAARMKVFKGDMAGALDDIIKQVGSADKLSKMSIYQHKAIADATGISTDALIEMISQQEKMNKFEKDYGKLAGMTAAQKNAALQDAIKNGNLNAKAILTQNIQQTQAERFKALQEELKMKFLELAQKFFPIILKVIAGLEKVFSYIGVKIKEIVRALGGGGAISVIGDSISSMIEHLGKFFVDVVADIILWIIGHKDDIASFFRSISTFIEKAMPHIHDLWKKIKGIGQAVEDFFGMFVSGDAETNKNYWIDLGYVIGITYLLLKAIPLINVFGKMIGGAIDAAKAFFSVNTAATTTGTTAVATGAKFSTLLTNLGVGIWQLMEGIASGFAAFANPLTIKGIAIVTAGIIGLGIALWLAKDAIKAVADAIAKIFTAMFENGDKVKLIFEGLATVIKTIFEGVANHIITMFNGLATLLGAPLKAIASVIEAVFKGIGTIIDSVGNSIVKIINSITDSIIRMTQIPTGKIAALAGELTLLNLAFMGMAGGSIISGIANWATGGGLLEQIKDLTKYSNQLDRTSVSIKALREAFEGFELPRFDSDSLDDIKDLIESVSELSANSKFVVNSRVEYNNKELVKKMDDLIRAVSDMKVVMDSREVGRLVSKNAYVPGS